MAVLCHKQLVLSHDFISYLAILFSILIISGVLVLFNDIFIN